MFFLLLLACSANDPADTQPKKPTEELSAQNENSAKPFTGKLDLTEETFSTDVLAPSPLETENAVKKAGLTTALSDLVQNKGNRNFDFSNASEDKAALQTGVLLCDLILSIEKTPKESALKSFDSIIQGMKQMKVGKGLMSTMKDLRSQFETSAISAKDLLEELDNIAALSVPGDGFSKDDQTGPLLQAGAWVSGVQLVAEAIKKENKLDAAEKLLRLEHVADYFLKYAKGEGSQKATSEVRAQLVSSLQNLKSLSLKEKITIADLDNAISETETLLEML